MERLSRSPIFISGSYTIHGRPLSPSAGLTSVPAEFIESGVFTVSVMSLLDGNGDVSNINIPVLTQIASASTTEMASIQPAEAPSVSIKEIVKKIVDDLARLEQQD